MLKSEYTNGPWKVDPKRKLRIRTEGDDTTVASCGTSDSIRDHWEANARLIAAAPELLEALKEAEKFVDRHSESWYTTGQELLTKMRAVIAKAEAK